MALVRKDEENANDIEEYDSNKSVCSGMNSSSNASCGNLGLMFIVVFVMYITEDTDSVDKIFAFEFSI